MVGWGCGAIDSGCKALKHGSEFFHGKGGRRQLLEDAVEGLADLAATAGACASSALACIIVMQLEE
jgi:hypothetical protein